MGRRKRKAPVYLTDEEKNEVYMLVLTGTKRKDVAGKYKVSLNQVCRTFNDRYTPTPKEFDETHAIITEKKQIPQPFNNYGMTTCNEFGKLTSIDNPCHQQILTIKTAA